MEDQPMGQSAVENIWAKKEDDGEKYTVSSRELHSFSLRNVIR
jgi:hypothetical protein